MKIAIDKESLSALKDDDNEYVYLFYDEPYSELKQLGLHCIRWNMCDYVDVNLTQYDLDCFKKAKATDPDFDKLPDKIDYKIGIIIPNYNYEHTIEKCLTSILNQTYTNYEIIFVDDMSTDDSVFIAMKYLSKFGKDGWGRDKLKIIELEQKRLNGGARNEAYLHLSDDVDFIYYIDSDDWLMDENSLQKINNKLQKNPDVLFVGMAVYKNGRTSPACIPQYKDKYEAFVGWSGSCGKVIKKELATKQECLYNEGTLKEDRNQHYKICINMKSFDILKVPVYVWNRDNTKSVTTIREKVNWGTSTIRHWADTMQLYLTYKGQDPRLDAILEERVEKTKDEAINNGDKQY